MEMREIRLATGLHFTPKAKQEKPIRAEKICQKLGVPARQSHRKCLVWFFGKERMTVVVKADYPAEPAMHSFGGGEQEWPLTNKLHKIMRTHTSPATRDFDCQMNSKTLTYSQYE